MEYRYNVSIYLNLLELQEILGVVIVGVVTVGVVLVGMGVVGVVIVGSGSSSSSNIWEW